MPVTPVASVVPDPLLQDAAQWWLRLREEHADDTLFDQIEAWRAQSPAHAEAWRQVQRGWARTAAPAPEPAAASPGAALPAAAPGRARPRRPRLRRWLAAAAVAGVMATQIPSLWLAWESDVRTGTGVRSVLLADGSRVTLDAASAIALEAEPGQRGVRLLAGRAFFEVAHDAAHLFVVRSGAVSVTVTGTRFEVSRLQGTSVSLLQGGVDVRHPCQPQDCVVHLQPGQQLQLDEDATTATQGEVAHGTGQWQHGRWLVQQAPLSEIAAQLQRYGRARIVIADPVLAAAPVTGAFDLHDPDAALALAVQAQGGRVRHITPWLRVVTRR
ncbi:hypothetical protein C1924_17960 [Stenotrophomonas sp. ESTM1D_MKCIP4_1]|uniref:FecR family protein n=1 Tax=Stenotrophomonas sp. ESTM1D_MKCIP4_1 TaxID=2072414 RepID=UPI000D53F7DD|nr:FecR domain-containing protein [Stenotrophomonas sp. ESTM1D_MKCIP4_1]AWH54935.1 hypothetical protein C1924_17960 [Stenotrophomonas sp. ESTM1D_MKCIP4_1]